MINFNLIQTNNLSKIKFGVGVVGKCSNLGIALLILLLLVIYKLENELAILFTVVVAIGTTIYFVKNLLSFAEKNPEISVLEGAELVAYKKVELKLKGNDSLFTESPSINDPHKVEVAILTNENK